MKKTIEFLTDTFWAIYAHIIIFSFLIIGVIGSFINWMKETVINVRNFLNYLGEMEQMDFIEEMLRVRKEHTKMIKYFEGSFRGEDSVKTLNIHGRKAKVEMIDFAIGTFLASQEATIEPSKQEKSHVTMKIMSDIDNMIYIVPDELKKYINVGGRVSVKTIGEYGFNHVRVANIITGGGHTLRGTVTEVLTDRGWIKPSYTDVL